MSKEDQKMKRPDYPFRAFRFDDYWVCEFPDLPGCIGTGETQSEAVNDALEASELWLEVYYEDNGIYPPVSDVYANTYSGNFSVRTSPTMHRNLAIRAAEEKVSMNALVNLLLAESLGPKQEPSINLINVSNNWSNRKKEAIQLGSMGVTRPLPEK